MIKGGATCFWYVIYTKPNSSLKVAKRLTDLGVEVYAPTRTEVRQWSDRKKRVQVPLFPSMVLVNIAEKDSNLVFQVPGVVRYLFEQGRRAKVQDNEVLAMQLYLEGKAVLDQAKVQVGDTVQVPQLDKKATVVALQGKKCLARLERLGAVVSFQLQ